MQVQFNGICPISFASSIKTLKNLAKEEMETDRISSHIDARESPIIHVIKIMIFE
jgi:hypothetical protein